MADMSHIFGFSVLILLYVPFQLASTEGTDDNGWCERYVWKDQFIPYRTREFFRDSKVTCHWYFGCYHKILVRYVLRTYTRATLVKDYYCCPGYIRNGSRCDPGCGVGFFGDGCDKLCNCTEIRNTNTHCGKETGKCLCNPGWMGNNCTERCSEGYFGDGCRNTCPCRNNATCDHVDGSCSCTVPGYTGAYCHQECAEGLYGRNCSFICVCNENQTCDPHTGKCTCKAGLTGQKCTTVCSNNTYGADCKKKCLCNPRGITTCDTVNGTCECLPGNIGVLCYDKCQNETFGDGCSSNCNCSSDAEYCRPSDGKCIIRASSTEIPGKSKAGRTALIGRIVGGIMALLVVIVLFVIVFCLRKRSKLNINSKPPISSQPMYSEVKMDGAFADAGSPDDDITFQKSDTEPFKNKAFQTEDDMYNVLNHTGRNSRPLDSELSQNTYGHLNMKIDDITGDDAYDVTRHTEKTVRKDDTYDHVEKRSDNTNGVPLYE